MTVMGHGDDSLNMGHGDSGLDMCHDDRGPDLTTSDPTGSRHHQAQDYRSDDIRIEYHPNSGRRTDTSRVNEYRQPLKGDATFEPEPWAPFRTREDLEFAELALEAGMTRGQVNAMIKLFHKCIKGDGSFTISNHKDMADTFEKASNRLAKVW